MCACECVYLCAYGQEIAGETRILWDFVCICACSKVAQGPFAEKAGLFCGDIGPFGRE